MSVRDMSVPAGFLPLLPTAAVGGLLGALVGGKKNRARNALIGAGAGGLLSTVNANNQANKITGMMMGGQGNPMGGIGAKLFGGLNPALGIAGPEDSENIDFVPPQDIQQLPPLFGSRRRRTYVPGTNAYSLPEPV